MRVAVISDIHGNIHALEAVLQAVAEDGPDEIWCLGDLVGYGPRPNECCEAVAEHAALCLVGNHDLGVLGALDLADFSDDASAAARWTRRVLSDAARAYLAALSPTAVRPRVELYHASPRDPVWEYVLTGEAMLTALALTASPFVVVGHSHVPIVFSASGELAYGPELTGAERDLATGRWLLNPGSVGQPRDGDPRASYLMLDPEHGQASFRRVVYDVEITQREIREEGLPDALAQRLAGGI